MQYSEKMTSLEIRASSWLAGIFGLRMLGVFLIIPVFAIYAKTLPGGDNYLLVGLAFGMYNLTQAFFQLPFGMASDKFGRKPVIYFGLILLAVGSFVAYSAQDIYWVIAGRAIQGAGAISAAVTALMADITREEHRTKAMALIGMSIGLAFGISMAISPTLAKLIGVAGIFALTGILSILAIFVVRFFIPDPKTSHFHSDTELSATKLSSVLKEPDLLRLNFGIFSLHAMHMAMFVVIPFALIESGGLDQSQHWKVYVPVLLSSVVLMIPMIIYGEKKGKLKEIFVGSVALLLCAQLLFSMFLSEFWLVVLSLLFFFVAFNTLEANIPSLISRIAPATAKGTAMGVHSTTQSLGLFVGAVAGGALVRYAGQHSVFIFGAALSGLWLFLASGMNTPPAVRNMMYRVKQMSETEAKALSQKLSALQGVFEAVVVGDEGTAYIKADKKGFDEQGVLQCLDAVQIAE